MCCCFIVIYIAGLISPLNCHTHLFVADAFSLFEEYTASMFNYIILGNRVMIPFIYFATKVFIYEAVGRYVWMHRFPAYVEYLVTPHIARHSHSGAT